MRPKSGDAEVMPTKQVRPKSIAISLLVISAVVLGGGLASARAAAPDATSSPAGPVTGVIVVFSPTFGAAPAGAVAPATLVGPRGPLLPTTLANPTAAGPTLPPILLLAPTSTGSLVVPVQLPAVSGSGVGFTQLQLVIPGPNPAQNTPIAVAQLLDMVLRSPQTTAPRGPAAPVSVFVTPSP